MSSAIAQIMLELLEKDYSMVASGTVDERSFDNVYKTVVEYQGNGILLGSVSGSSDMGSKNYAFRYTVDGISVFGCARMDPFCVNEVTSGSDSYQILIPFKSSIKVEIKSFQDEILTHCSSISCCIYSK